MTTAIEGVKALIKQALNDRLEYLAAFSFYQTNVREKSENCPLLPFEFFITPCTGTSVV
jgi:hypothetical protein